MRFLLRTIPGERGHPIDQVVQHDLLTDRISPFSSARYLVASHIVAPSAAGERVDLGMGVG